MKEPYGLYQDCWCEECQRYERGLFKRRAKKPGARIIKHGQ